MSDGGENREVEEEGSGGWMDGGSQPGRPDRLWAVTLQLNEPKLLG